MATYLKRFLLGAFATLGLAAFFIFIYGPAEGIAIFTPAFTSNRMSTISSTLHLVELIFAFIGGLALLPLFWLVFRGRFRLLAICLMAFTVSICLHISQSIAYQKLRVPIITKGNACPFISNFGLYYLAYRIYLPVPEGKIRADNDLCNFLREFHSGTQWKEWKEKYYSQNEGRTYGLSSMTLALWVATQEFERASGTDSKHLRVPPAARLGLVENILLILNRHSLRLDPNRETNPMVALTLPYFYWEEKLLIEQLMPKTRNILQKHLQILDKEKLTAEEERRIHAARELAL